MWGKKFGHWLLVLTVAACSQTPERVLPNGISLLSSIDRKGLAAPIWSPDGKTIAMSYIVRAMPDIMGFFGPEPRADVILVNTQTWQASSVFTQKWGDLTPQSWSSDSKSFVMSWQSGPQGNGTYRFQVESAKPEYLSGPGVLSPDESRLAVIAGPDVPYVSIEDLRSQKARGYLPQTDGDWRIHAWSPDLKYLTLTRGEEDLEGHGFRNIYLLEVSSGIFTQFTRDGNLNSHSPTIAANGELIAYLSSSWSGDLRSRLIISRLDHGCQWTMPLADIYDFAWSPDNKRMFLLGRDAAYLADLDVVYGSSFSSGEPCN